MTIIYRLNMERWQSWIERKNIIFNENYIRTMGAFNKNKRAGRVAEDSTKKIVLIVDDKYI